MIIIKTITLNLKPVIFDFVCTELEKQFQIIKETKIYPQY